MPPAPPPQQSGQDNSSAMLWIVAMVFATLGGVWYAFKNQIIAFYLTVKLYEVYFLSHLTQRLHLDTYYYYFEQLRSVILFARNNPTSITFNDLLNLGTGVGNWLRIPFVVLMFIMAILVYVSNTAHVFRRIYSMRDLAKLEKMNWPQISPVLELDLIKTDIDAGPWAMAMTPMQFCKRYKLLEEVRPQRREGMTRKEWDRIDVVLKRGEANKLFAMQLGPLWRGIDKIPPYSKALFAVFAARANADTAAAVKLLRQLNLSNPTALNMAGVDELIKKHENTKIVQKVLHSHAYVLTIMASMLAIAREDGVQASADFLWLKPVDRRLWYTLNTVGRQTPFIEVAGIFAHWIAEKEAARRLIVPMVEEATKAVEIALKEVIYKKDEA
jgi:intracellular multiplication protein IcmP